MKLVDYSDSEASDSDNEKAPSPPPAPKLQHANLPPKPPAKKQILVDLPKPSQTDDDEPVRKRLRPEGEGKGGLFSILPPPKRSKPNTNGPTKEEQTTTKPMNTDYGEPKSVSAEPPPPPTTTFVPRSAQQKKGKPVLKQPEKPPAVSLFPLGPDLVSKSAIPTKSSTPSTYEPLIAQPLPQTYDSLPESTSVVPDTTAALPSTISTADLDSFAAHILEGRHRKNRTIQIMDYNAAEIYARNAADKASGVLQDQVQPVRAIGSGRHQIHQLLNNVQDQRESLEEAFAEGRRVKKESAAKYGW